MKDINKRAMAESALALLIIAIITMGVLGVFVYKYTERQSCIQKVELCKMSITVVSAYKKALGIDQVLSIVEPKIDCPICVPDSSGNIKNKEEKETMQEIANHLRWCWYKTTGQNNLAGGTAEGQIQFCTVCSEFKTAQEISIINLLSFLREKKINTGPGAGETYQQYLSTTLPIDKIFDYQFIIDNSLLATSQPDSRAFSTLQTELNKQSLLHNILPNKQYQVINYNLPFSAHDSSKVSFNQIFLVPTEDVVNLPCEIYHYQKE